jgi:hypothetical protein
MLWRLPCFPWLSSAFLKLPIKRSLLLILVFLVANQPPVARGSSSGPLVRRQRADVVIGPSGAMLFQPHKHSADEMLATPPEKRAATWKEQQIAAVVNKESGLIGHPATGPWVSGSFVVAPGCCSQSYLG